MPGLYTADEAFQIALEMEETGQLFYEALAGGSGHKELVDFFHRLVTMEREHYRKFQKLRQEYGQPQRPMGFEQLDRVQELIAAKAIPDRAHAQQVARQGSLAASLELAILMEDLSVDFYAALREVVQPADAKAVSTIIEEERQHAQLLRNALMQL